EAGGDGDAEQLRQDVQIHLRDEKLTFARLDNHADEMPLKYATFVVDTVPIDERGGQQAEQLAVAKNRWRQLQQPSLSLDGLWDAGAEPCTLDRTRTATERHCLTSDDKNVPLCRSTLARWHYGR